ncbi:MAG: UPF0182 family protein, partial [Egibacteraceae bacterium]
MSRPRRRWWLFALAVGAVVLLFGTRVARFYTDVLWYDSLGFAGVFWRILGTRVGLGLVAGLLVAGLVGGNLWLARRLAPPYRIPSPQEAVVERYRQAVLPYLRPLLAGVAVVLGLLSGLSMTSAWPTFLLWLNRQDFGQADPQFGRDLGFFVFALPLQSIIASWLFASLVITLVVTAIAHYVFGGIRPQAPGQKITPEANVHLSVLLAALVGARAWGLYLDQFGLSYSLRGTVTGLSYTDVTAQLPAYRLLLFITLFCMVLFLVNVRSRGWLLPAAGVGILLVTAVVLGGIFPAVVQRLQVDPQELERERPYIERNLEATRRAFGLDDVREERFAAEQELSPEEVVDNAETINSIRLWDPAVAQAAYEQLQELRPYYTFRDVDVDRYTLEDGSREQLLVAAREITGAELPADTWANRHLVFTHGIGMVASEVSTSRADGQPNFVVSDIPPSGDDALTADNSRVYVGESGVDYAVVGTRQRELDFARIEGPPEETSYDGEDGVGVGSFGRRLAFALRFTEPNLVLSNLLTDESKVLYRRQVRERVEAVAPFLKLDHDPYPVAADGRIKYVIDAYTTSDMVPYSERVDLGELTLAEQRQLVATTNAQGQTTISERTELLPGIEGRANYIRNSVKAVVDAYDGTVTLYVIDDTDPLIQAWRRAFPTAFADLADASDELRSHFRYPEDLFRVQAAVYATYHIQSPDEFYTKEDAWQIPMDPASANNQQGLPEAQRRSRELRPSYQLIRLPGAESAEFALIGQYTPRGADRKNLIAYLAAAGDPDDYGQMRVFLMPPNRTVFGPEQIQARIDQDRQIAREVSLLNQQGSAVIYGNLLTIPIEDALLYTQGLFIRAQQSEIPELRFVVMVFGDQVIQAASLADGLQELFGVTPEGVGEPGEVEPPEGEPPPPPPEGEPPPPPP